MSNAPLTESNSPLTRDQAERMSELVADLRNEQITWLSGYLAGLTAAGAAEAPAAAQAPAGRSAEAPEITILFGSQTGNAEEVARQAATQAEAHGFRPQVLDMADVKKPQLKAAARLLVIVSTHGEGDPPDTALELHELMHSKKAPPLKDTKFSVLALGDTSYEHFCQTGRDFDERLEALGATRIHPRTDCDVDFDDAAEAWVGNAIGAFAGELETPPSNVVAFGPVGGEAAAATWSKKKPFQASLIENLVLNADGSRKETRHLELSLEDSGLEWQPGDSLGVLAQNDPQVVDEILAALGFGGDETVTGPRGEVSLREALTHDYEITTLTRPFLQGWADAAGADELRALLADDQRDALREWMYGRHIVDVLQTWPVDSLTPQAFVERLRKLPARLYSIASSCNANPDEVHLTVAAVRYEAHGREREGVASTWLADRVDDDTPVPVYIDTNKNFRLPDDDSAPIIMIGPGTGVAPFRAFVEEREHRGADGANWLFFGDQHFHTDFLYQREWLRWREQGMLDRVDVAFSRDQADKVYVQDRLRERGAEVYQWLEQGAHVYVCGDADYMAPDVHQALIDVIAEHGGRSPDDAAAWLGQLQKEKRYQRDVY